MNMQDIPTEGPELDKLNEWFEKKFEEEMKKKEAAHTPSMAIIATRGTLDWAYPPFILGSTGAALGWDVKIFFTFYGLVDAAKRNEPQSQPAWQSGHAHENAHGT